MTYRNRNPFYTRTNPSPHPIRTGVLTGSALLAALMLFVGSSHAAVLTVGSSGCSNTTIAAAVSAAADGDTIRIMDSVITESGIYVNPVNKSLTIEGLGLGTIVQADAVRNTASNRIFRVNLPRNRTLTIRNLTLRHGVADTSGGGAIWLEYGSMIVSNCVITMNDSVGGGGGICVPDQKGNVRTNYLTVLHSEISSNATTGAAGDGGGINIVGSSLDLDGCSIFSNSASRHGGGLNHSSGNSIHSLTRNSTFYMNSAASGRSGGGIYYAAASTGGVYNCTIYSNTFTGGTGYGGGIAAASTILAISSSIIASNYNGSGNQYDLFGTSNMLVSTCLISQSGSWPYLLANINNKTNNPRLGALGYHGGPTVTLPLLAGSPCLDSGLNDLGFATDQRGPGFNRTWGSGCDIGAYEYGAGVALSYSRTNFSESMPANNGTIDNSSPLLISIANDTFTGADGDQLTNQVTATNIPVGLTLSMIRTNSGTAVQVELLGTATHRSAVDSLSNLGLTFADGAFTLGHAAEVSNSSRTNLTVTFFDPIGGGGTLMRVTDLPGRKAHRLPSELTSIPETNSKHVVEQLTRLRTGSGTPRI